ncbi:MAG: flagellar biosynthesis protein FlhB [Candidatus Polarisedimenticolaceae bacterium]|nr:flagellar biosynthesis protein FlhB [Candidatus Polarisedimenticolaceae bacterium]
MAENETGQDKTEEPTTKRLDESRKKGQIARSRELNTMAITLVGTLSLVLMSSQLGEGLSQLMSDSFTISRVDIFEPRVMLERLKQAIIDAFILLGPFFIIMPVVAILSSVILGGIAFSTEPMAPKLSKLSPLKGLKRMVSVKSLVELLKTLAKFGLVGGVTAILLNYLIDDFIVLNTMELHQGVSRMRDLIGWSVVLIASTLILVAAIDVPFQIWDHKKQLKMTRQEIRDEMKETDGRPEVKSRIRQLQHEMAQRRMMDEVPKADVIVTNPTHYAVALRYDQTSMGAPKLVAKGADLVAANIRNVAAEANVPIIESPILARAIYFSTDLGHTIPAALYLVVAKLLAYIFQLKVYTEHGGTTPGQPELSVPDDFKGGKYDG